MKIKIIGEGKHRISDDILLFKNKNGEQIEIDQLSAEKIVWTLLDSLGFAASEMDEIIDKIEDKLCERGCL